MLIKEATPQIDALRKVADLKKGMYDLYCEMTENILIFLQWHQKHRADTVKAHQNPKVVALLNILLMLQQSLTLEKSV